MSELTTTALASLNTALDKLIAKVQASAGNDAELATTKQELADVQAQLQTLTDKINAAAA